MQARGRARGPKKSRRRGPQFSKFVLNCVESPDTQSDWTFDAATAASFVDHEHKYLSSVDLRKPWWTVRDQGNTGACVGFATADGVLRWMYEKEGMIEKTDLISPRFIWMANKETDDLTSYPTSFLDSAGTSTKLALKVARKYGCVLENMLPMSGRLSRISPQTFFSISSQYRINAYYNLKANGKGPLDLEELKCWLSQRGPILTRLDVDETWKKATTTNGELETYMADKTHGGHAVCFVGYTKDYFIVRNSWGENWGDKGFAYASYDYTKAAFTEVYGAVLNRLELVKPREEK